jgi:hypothetical protein
MKSTSDSAYGVTALVLASDVLVMISYLFVYTALLAAAVCMYVFWVSFYTYGQWSATTMADLV